MKIGRVLASSAVFVVLVAACTPPPPTKALPPVKLPSPTPTTPLAATAPTFHIGEVGIAYGAVALTATGGVQPYKYTVQSGALPGGLAIGSDGSISGTPTASGDFTFTIAISDSGDSTTTVDGKISIADALAAHLRPECASYCNVELGCTTACGNFGTLTGGVAPVAFSLLSGSLPAGTSLNGFSLNGTFSGQTGWVQFTVQASDALGAATTISPKFWMYPHISFGGGTVPTNPNSLCFYSGAPNWPGCTAQFPYSGGTPNAGAVSVTATWVSYTCAAGPPKPSITAQGGFVTVAIPSGTPNCNGYSGVLSVVLTDRDVCSVGPTYCSSAAANVNVRQLPT